MLPSRGARFDLVVDGERIALVEANVRTPETVEGFVFTWTASAPVPIVLRRPAGTDIFAMMGDVLFAAARDDGRLVAVDLRAAEAPLATLSPEAAVAAVMSDPNEHTWDAQLERLPGLGPYLVQRLRKPDDPIVASALRYLAKRPVPEALPVLLDLLPRSRDERMQVLVVGALAAQDDLRASQALVAFARDRAAAREHLWRTGRTSTLGLCPPEGPRPLAIAGPDDGAAIGTAHPVVFQEVAPDGRWVVVCQAREDSDGDGHIAIRIGQHGDSSAETPLAPTWSWARGRGTWWTRCSHTTRQGATWRFARARASASSTRGHGRSRRCQTPICARRTWRWDSSRAASFDAAGTRMLYHRGGVPRPRVVVRRLDDGREVAIDPGGGDLLRASIDGEGTWVLLDVVEDGPWPRAFTSLAPRACRGGAASFSVGSRSGGTVVKRVAPAGGGPARHVPGLIRPFGRDLLVRGSDDELAVVDAHSLTKRRTLVPASCHGVVLHADDRRGLVLVACGGRGNERGASIEMHGAGKPVSLGRWLRPDEDQWQPGQPRYVFAGDGLVDLDCRRLVDGPQLAAGEARAVDSRDLLKQGVYAVRADGARLRAPHVPEASAEPGPRPGPLRWEPVSAGRGK